MKASWYLIAPALAILTLASCTDLGEPDGPVVNDFGAQPSEADDRDDQPAEPGENDEPVVDEPGAQPSEADDGDDQPAEPGENEEPVPITVDPLVLSGSFGTEFETEPGSAGPAVRGAAEGEAGGLAVRAVLAENFDLDVVLVNEDSEIKQGVQVDVAVDYSKVERYVRVSDPDTEEPADHGTEESQGTLVAVERPDEVVADFGSSVGNCNMEPDEPAQLRITCDMGDLGPQGEANVLVEFVRDDLYGSISLTVGVEAKGQSGPTG